MGYKEEFIKFMIDCGVLTFGDFTLKSGRKAPYFINTGNYKTGYQLACLGGFYAECIKDNKLPVETLFGTAYKGIPLAVACAIALAEKFNTNVNYCFNRKVVKDHGEGGVLVGKTLTDGEKVVIIEDVITAGTAIRQVVPILKEAADIEITGMVISVDRMEKGQGDISAIEEVNRDFGFEVYPIVTVEDIIAAIRNGDCLGREFLDRIIDYRRQYGA